MAGRSGYGCLAVAILAGERLAVLRDSTDHAAVIAAYRGWLSKLRSEMNRYTWRSMTARRAQALARTWRDFNRGFRGLEWRRRKVDPGVWTVELLDASGAWIKVATVEAPPLRRMDDRPNVRVIALPDPVTVTVLRVPDHCVEASRSTRSSPGFRACHSA